jgi:hypothetical protein
MATLGLFVLVAAVRLMNLDANCKVRLPSPLIAEQDGDFEGSFYGMT